MRRSCVLRLVHWGRDLSSRSTNSGLSSTGDGIGDPSPAGSPATAQDRGGSSPPAHVAIRRLRTSPAGSWVARAWGSALRTAANGAPPTASVRFRAPGCSISPSLTGPRIGARGSRSDPSGRRCRRSGGVDAVRALASATDDDVAHYLAAAQAAVAAEVADIEDVPCGARRQLRRTRRLAHAPVGTASSPARACACRAPGRRSVPGSRRGSSASWRQARTPPGRPSPSPTP